MKKTNRFLFTLFLISISTFGFSQKDDIGISFTKRGYIQEIIPEKNILLVNFIDQKSIYTEKSVTKNQPAITIDGIPSGIQQLRCGMEVKIEGEYFESGDYNIPEKIVAFTKQNENIDIKKGRLDAVNGIYGYVDGNKIKLAKETKIYGANKTGYSNKVFNGFSDLKLGCYVNIEGKYSPKGYLLAYDVTVEPETETDNDKQAKEALSEFHEKIYPIWSEPTKRPALFGESLGDLGTIVSSSELQDYVNKVAFSLIPNHIKKKIHFMFIVTDNLEWNANVRANGVSFVYSGLLFSLDNEAQLAAVLGHEIGHAIYEHSAERAMSREEAERRKEKRERTSQTVRDVVGIVKPKIYMQDNRGRVVYGKEIKTGTAELLIKDLPDARGSKRLSDFSVDNELQADRIGLYLMANAGYDPREVPIVWKNVFNDREKVKQNKKQEVNSYSSATNGDILDRGFDAINNAIKRKIDGLKQKSKKTHPDDLKRFEELNMLIGTYYSDPQWLASTKTGEDKYHQVIGRYLNNRKKAMKQDEETTMKKQISHNAGIKGNQTKSKNSTHSRHTSKPKISK